MVFRTTSSTIRWPVTQNSKPCFVTINNFTSSMTTILHRSAWPKHVWRLQNLSTRIGSIVTELFCFLAFFMDLRPFLALSCLGYPLERVQILSNTRFWWAHWSPSLTHLHVQSSARSIVDLRWSVLLSSMLWKNLTSPDPNYAFTSRTLPKLLELADQTNPGRTNAIDGDISPFIRRGGKLLTYVGLAGKSVILVHPRIWAHMDTESLNNFRSYHPKWFGEIGPVFTKRQSSFVHTFCWFDCQR